MGVLSADLVQGQELRRFERRCNTHRRRVALVVPRLVEFAGFTAKVRTNIAANHRQSCEVCTLAPGLCIGIMANQPCGAMHNKAVNTDAQGRPRAARAPVLGRGLLLR
jgi:hypothetical protein